jgi:hypothetical protein
MSILNEGKKEKNNVVFFFITGILRSEKKIRNLKKKMALVIPESFIRMNRYP